MKPFFSGCISLLCLLLAFPTVAQDESTQGIATYYNDKWTGKPTSSGEILDKVSFTCAHRTYPMGTLLKVTNTATGTAVVVRVNDKEPKTSIYIVTVTRRAAEILDMIKLGGKMPATVEMVQGLPVGKWEPNEAPAEVVADFEATQTPQSVSIADMPPPAIATDGRAKAAEASKPPVVGFKKMGLKTAVPPTEALSSESVVPQPQPAQPAQPEKIVRLTAAEDPNFKIKAVQHKETTLTPTGFAVQMGAMNTHEKAIELVSKLNNQDKINNVMMTSKSDSTGDMYKILVGPFDDVAVAKQYRDACRKNGITCFVVDVKTMIMVQ
jgi:rare lipoprotein A (peptidoglycan hydrolase)